jgi:nucleoside-triphosphatase
MKLKSTKMLLTGLPGIGKTTLIRKIVSKLPKEKMAGFYTAEIRSGGIRKGFELHGLNGETGVLAHVDISSRRRVGKYGVDVSGFEAFLDRLDLLNPKFDFIVIDEIGKMEIFSNRFCVLIRKVIDSDKNLLGTIALKGGGLIYEIKKRADIRILEVTRSNRNNLLPDIFQIIHQNSK